MQQQVESQLLASYESLYRLAYTYVKNPDDAMDVVQESAFKAISRSADVRSPAAIRGWLCRIVVNTAMDVLRARSRQADAEHIPETGQEAVSYTHLDVYKRQLSYRACRAAAYCQAGLSIPGMDSSFMARAAPSIRAAISIPAAAMGSSPTAAVSYTHLHRPASAAQGRKRGLS